MKIIIKSIRKIKHYKEIKDIIDKISKNNIDKIIIDEYDYFTAKYIDLYTKKQNVDVIWIYENKKYKDLYDLPDDVGMFKMMDEIYLLDVKIEKNKLRY